MLRLITVTQDKWKKKKHVLISLLPEKIKMALHAVTENNDFQYREDHLQSDFDKFKVMCWFKYINIWQKKAERSHIG